MNQIIVGWKECISLTQLNISEVVVKIDTGAKTSSLHATNIKYMNKGNQTLVHFDVHPLQQNEEYAIHCQAPLLEKRVIKSSSGCQEERPIIKTTINLGELTWDIELNLTNRDYMGCRMLLGRQAMAGHILVDPQKTFASTTKPTHNKSI